MNDPREIECVRLAWAARTDIAKQQLDEVYAREFEGPLSGMRLWPAEYRGIKQLLLLPVVWLIILFAAVFTPVLYLMHHVAIHKYARELRNKIHQHFDPSSLPDPDRKTLGALWELCDLPGDLGEDSSAELLNSWLVILYGQDLARLVSVQTQMSDIAQRQFEANRPFYEGEDAPHFHFVSPIKVLIRELTEKLPPYSEKA